MGQYLLMWKVEKNVNVETRGKDPERGAVVSMAIQPTHPRVMADGAEAGTGGGKPC